MTWPIAEYDHSDPVLGNRAAVTGVVVARTGPVMALRNRIVFGDNPSGEVFHVSADDTTTHGQSHIRRVLLMDGGEAKPLLQVIREKNAQQGRQPASRADLRFGSGANGEIFLLNKADGVVRMLVPASP
jgi:hypothetical protein